MKIVLILIALSLIGCKKNFTCECKGSITNFEGKTNTYFKPYKKQYFISDSKKNAFKKCQSKVIEHDYYTYTSIEVENCELK